MRDSYRESHFQIWKQRIENHVGIKLDEITDEPYRYWFEETHMTPIEISMIIKKKMYLQTIRLHHYDVSL